MIISRHPSHSQEWVIWKSPVRIRQTSNPSEVANILCHVEADVAGGLLAVGFIGYEAGAGLDASISARPTPPSIPLVWFALFTEYQTYQPSIPMRSAQRIRWKPSLSKSTYTEAIGQIKKHIAAGDTYQVNFTFPLTTTDPVSMKDLFFRLVEAQPSPYAMFIETPEFHIASASPELFFRLENKAITVEPMKGTCPRGWHPDLDRAAGSNLEQSEKNRAENIMIVDMMRNDLSRIATPGTVKVDQLFITKAWPTLWQMTSTVSALTELSIREMMAHLFPCASITGAPKIKTSEIISKLEQTPRGVYTGAIGWWLPNRRVQFAVAIRTAVQDRVTNQTTYGVGSGIVWDSEAGDEYRECLLKATILSRKPQRFRLLETMRWAPTEGYLFFDAHVNRIIDSAAFFGWKIKENTITTALKKKAESFPMSDQRVRLILQRDGRIVLTHQDATSPGQFNITKDIPVMTARLDDQQTNCASPWLYHKTTRRTVYTRAMKRSQGADEVLLVNERSELMEFCNGNVVLQFGEDLVTPPLVSGLLPGVFRHYLLQQKLIKTRVLTKDDLKDADAIFYLNSVRGWRRIDMVT